VEDGKLVFGNSPLAAVIENNDQGNKLGATVDPENMVELKNMKKSAILHGNLVRVIGQLKTRQLL
jgi:hypothetical protein